LATIRLHKRNSTFVELAILVEELSNIGLPDTLKKYYHEPVENEAKSIVAGPTFIQYLNKLFKTQIAACATYYSLSRINMINSSCSH
jgi:hypothetical protein